MFRPFRMSALLPLLALVACSDKPSPAAVARLQAAWASHHLTNYSYEILSTGFFNTLTGQAIRVVVLGDTVRSADFVATGDSVPVALSAFATVNELFASAMEAARNGSLNDIDVDPTLDYPRRLVYGGPPDASGTIAVSHLQPLP